MSRQNFSPKVKEDLARRANYRCVHPGCAQLTHSFDPDSNQWINLGNAAHDYAAGQRGPRPAPITMTPEQIKAYENGAWLCVRHAGLVDKVTRLYPPGRLPEMQEAAVRRLLGQTLSDHNLRIDYQNACAGADRFCKELDKIHIQPQWNKVVEIESPALGQIASLLRDCNLLSPRNPLSALYYNAVAKQKQVLDVLSEIRRRAEDHRGLWCFVSDWPSRYVLPRTTRWDSQTYIDSINDEAFEVYVLYREVLDSKAELRAIANGEVDGTACDLW